MKRYASTASMAAIAIAIAVNMGGVCSAAAQDAGELEEVVVTARKTAENLQEVPIAVTAFTGEQLEQQSAVRVTDIARLTPSLRMEAAASNPSAATISLRGQVQSDTLATLDPSVGTYVDGVYWARAYGLNADLLDVQSVQILKGPQGTLFGRNTTGGAILFQTNDPSYGGVSGMVRGSYGSYDEMIGTAVVNIPVISDKLAIRAAVQKNRRDGVVFDRTSARYVDDRDSWSGRLKIRANPVDNFEILLSAETYSADFTGPIRYNTLILPTGLLAIGPNAAAQVAEYKASADEDTLALNLVSHTIAKTDTYAGTFTLDTDFATLKYIVSTRSVVSSSFFDLDGSPFAVHQTNGVIEAEQVSHELQATGEAFSGGLKFAVGAFYFTEEGNDSSQTITTPALNPNTNIFDGTFDHLSKGVYGQATWNVTDALAVTGGLRYSVEEKGLEVRNRAINRLTGAPRCTIVPAVLPECLVERSDEFDGVSYTLGVDYDITDDVMVYAKSSKGFRSGGQNLRATNLTSFRPFEAEEAVDYEIGLKSTFWDRRVRLNLAAYQVDVENIQRSTIIAETVIVGGVPQTNSSTVVGNAGELRIRGFEAELDALVTDELRLSATAALIDPEYISYVDPNTGVDRSNERFTMVPEQSFTFSATWTKDLEFGRLTLRGDYAYTGETAIEASNDTSSVIGRQIIAATTQPAAGIVNLRAAVELPDDRWELAAFARNVTDNRDPLVATTVNPLHSSVILREPRTVGVSATYRFGE